MFNIMDNMKDDGSVKRGSKLICMVTYEFWSSNYAIRLKWFPL